MKYFSKLGPLTTSTDYQGNFLQIFSISKVNILNSKDYIILFYLFFGDRLFFLWRQKRSLETEEVVQLDTETALSFQDDISYWQFKIGRLLKRKQDTPVSQFYYSSLKQEPAPRMYVNLPKINIKSFGGDPLQWLTFWDSFSAAIDKNHGLSDIEKN